MAFAQSLPGVRTKLAVKAAQTNLVLNAKLATGGFNGGTGSTAIGAGRVITTTFAPVSRVPTFVPTVPPPPPIPRPPVPPFTPLAPAGPLFDPRGPQLGGLSSAACDLLTGTAKSLCLLGFSFLPRQEGGGGPVLPQFPGTGPVADPPSDPGVILPGQVATVGAFGLPALSPAGVSRLVRKCGRGMVLGIDNLCYPKAVLTSRSKFRKWRRPPRPPVTRRDVVAIRRAAGARDRVAELAKDVGLKIGSSRKKKKKSAAAVHHER